MGHQCKQEKADRGDGHDKIIRNRRGPFCKTCFLYLPHKKMDNIVEGHPVKTGQYNFLAPVLQEPKKQCIVYDAFQFGHGILRGIIGQPPASAALIYPAPAGILWRTSGALDRFPQN